MLWKIENWHQSRKTNIFTFARLRFMVTRTLKIIFQSREVKLVPKFKIIIKEAVARRCVCRKGVLRNFPKFTGKRLCQSLFFNKVGTGDSSAGVSCKFCEISKNTFFIEHLRWLLLFGVDFHYQRLLNVKRNELQRRIQNPAEYLRWSVLQINY